jgi:pilus assembly protein CpaB
MVLVLALGVAGFGAVGWIGLHQPTGALSGNVHPTQPPHGPPARVTVLTAAHLVRVGELLKPDDLAPVEMSADAPPPGALADTPGGRSGLFGAMLRRTLEAGTAIQGPDVMRVTDRGFLAAVLSPGMRAATVGVDSVSGTPGLIWPGDHVDLILTQSNDDTTAAPGRRISAETVLQDLRVIAIDQALIEGAPPAPAPPGSLASQTRTVTFEVTPEGAERIAVASRLGRLSLSVIAATPAAAGSRAATPLTWGADVSAALQEGPRNTSATLHLFEGSGDGKEFHF